MRSKVCRSLWAFLRCCLIQDELPTNKLHALKRSHHSLLETTQARKLLHPEGRLREKGLSHCAKSCRFALLSATCPTFLAPPALHSRGVRFSAVIGQGK